MASSPSYSHSRLNGSTSSTSNFSPGGGPGPGARASSSTQGTRSSTATSVNPLASSHMESTVTRLLVATKQLLESLTDWSHCKIDEGAVSDIYVRLGNEFNAASLAFSREGIDMSDLNSVPDDLRVCLEAALSEEAAPATLDQHLPQIRQIVVHLLQGLKAKQAKWRATKRQQSIDLHQGSPNPNLIRPGSSREIASAIPNPGSRVTSRTLSGAKSREELRRVAVASPSGDHYRGQTPRQSNEGSHRRPSGDQPRHEAPARESSKPRLSPGNRPLRPLNEAPDRIRGPISPSYAPLPAPSSQIPGLPATSTPLLPEASRSGLSANRSNQTTPSQASSLEALRKVELLQRRASKRFSTYTYNKIASTASPHKRGDGQTGIGLGITVPALPMSPKSLAQFLPREEITAARETSEAGRELLKRSKSNASRPELEEIRPAEESSSANDVAGAETLDQAKASAVPIFEESEMSLRPNLTPEPPQNLSELYSSPSTKVMRANSAHSASAVSHSEHPTIFLQLGRDVKKAKLDSPPTIPSLRVLFMDRFQYSPGSDDFPEIYLRDPQSGVQYQLEDMSDVRDRVVLSLNIDVLDQVKTHIDTGMTSLTREIKELKSTIASLRRQSIPPPPPSSSVTGSNLVSAVSPGGGQNPVSQVVRRTDSQFTNAARQVLQRVNTGSQSQTGESSLTPSPNLNSENDTSPIPPDSAVSASDLKLQQLSGVFKNQFSQVQSLRRELGILRQLYGTFTGETKSMLSTLRSQSEQVKQVASTKISTSRTFIDAGKTKVESKSQDLVTKVESLQDTVEDLKQDVTSRKIRPKPNAMSSVSQSIEAVTAELEDFTNYLATIKPSWKKSWEDELQNIVDEQQLLNYQEDLVKDLKEDLTAVSSLFGHVKDYIDARKVSKAKPKEFIPPIGFGSSVSDPKVGLDTVLMQVKSMEPDIEGRLKAIELAEKNRERKKEEVGLDDEFAKELAGFVGEKKLKMTGGTEEIERIRSLKSEQALKALLGGGSSNSNTLSNSLDSNNDLNEENEKEGGGDVGDPEGDEGVENDKENGKLVLSPDLNATPENEQESKDPQKTE